MCQALCKILRDVAINNSGAVPYPLELTGHNHMHIQTRSSWLLITSFGDWVKVPPEERGGWKEKEENARELLLEKRQVSQSRRKEAIVSSHVGQQAMELFAGCQRAWLQQELRMGDLNTPVWP